MERFGFRATEDYGCFGTGEVESVDGLFEFVFVANRSVLDGANALFLDAFAELFRAEFVVAGELLVGVG